MKNETNRYRLFPVENLQSTWGPCGSNTTALAMHDRLPPPSQTWARRVGGQPHVVSLGSWGLQLGTPTARPSGEILPFVSEGWSYYPVYLEVVAMMWAEHNQILKAPSL